MCAGSTPHQHRLRRAGGRPSARSVRSLTAAVRQPGGASCTVPPMALPDAERATRRYGRGGVCRGCIGCDRRWGGRHQRDGNDGRTRRRRDQQWTRSNRCWRGLRRPARRTRSRRGRSAMSWTIWTVCSSSTAWRARRVCTLASAICDAEGQLVRKAPVPRSAEGSGLTQHRDVGAVRPGAGDVGFPDDHL